jgi:tagaturonate reductase
VRVLPTILAYQRLKHKLPERLIQSFAALIVFYKGEWQGERLPLKDSSYVLDFFHAIWLSHEVSGVVQKVLSNSRLWDMDLSTVPGLQVMLEKEINTLKLEE